MTTPAWQHDPRAFTVITARLERNGGTIDIAGAVWTMRESIFSGDDLRVERERLR
jgi:hypothetical protein